MAEIGSVTDLVSLWLYQNKKSEVRWVYRDQLSGRLVVTARLGLLQIVAALHGFSQELVGAKYYIGNYKEAKEDFYIFNG